ncbi:sugar phosphate isomerase/epimerase [Candidatus Bathyarchaeota archaeon]|nr:MAG: sugar phosphate isomerase/epimerase [Candidatus Bathyarchaeota archaeon]
MRLTLEIGFSMLYCLSHSFSKALSILEEARFKNVEIVDEGLHSLNEERVDAIRKIAYDRDLEISIHSPFINVDIASISYQKRRASLRRLKKSILLSGKLDSPLWVLHSGLRNNSSYLFSDVNWEMNLRSIRELAEFSKMHGVRVTVENGISNLHFLLSKVEDFNRFYDNLGDYEIGLTLDVGHANIEGEIFRFLKEYAGKIVHTHLHDNHGISDEHLGIGDGNINWRRVIQTFKEINYKGSLIVESVRDVDGSLSRLVRLIRETSILN